MNVDAPVSAAPAAAGAQRLKSRHLLGIAGMDAAEISLILDTAEAMKEVGTRPIKKVPALRGRTVVNLFFEPSTRTRTSFEIAEKRLSADTLNVAIASSSVVKGETLVDTAMNIEAMAPDMIVLRHASSGESSAMPSRSFLMRRESRPRRVHRSPSGGPARSATATSAGSCRRSRP